MIKNIVIEGPNNVGKTTLIEYLLELNEFKNWRVEHMTAESPNSFDFYDATLRNCTRTIFDRHCIGETIYPVLRGADAGVTADDIVKLVKTHTDTLFIFVTADLTFISKAYVYKDEIPNWYYITDERRLFDVAYDALKENKHVILYENKWDDDTRDTPDLVKIIDELTGR